MSWVPAFNQASTRYVVSGDVFTLTADEVFILSDYQRLRAEGHGHLFVEFVQHRVTKHEVKLGGRVGVLNGLLGILKE